MLKVENLTKRFGGLLALNDITLSVAEGEIVGLIGPNGAGKTTLFNVITGFATPNSGSIDFQGANIESKSPEFICRRGICRTFQVVRPFNNISVLDNVVIGALNRCRSVPNAREMSEEIIKFVGLEGVRQLQAKSLTLGYRKRLEVARALVTGPKLLLLDEVMAGLNATEVNRMIGLILRMRESGMTLFVIEHIMKAIMTICNRVIVLHYGKKIADGAPSEIAKNSDVIQAYLGEEYVLA